MINENEIKIFFTKAEQDCMSLLHALDEADLLSQAPPTIARSGIVLRWLESCATRPNVNLRLPRVNHQQPDAAGFTTKNHDMEVILKHIWTLLRCGKVAEAKLIATEYKLYWLAASLGGGEPFSARSEVIEYENKVYMDYGNSKPALWFHACWEYADKLCVASSDSGSQGK